MAGSHRNRGKPHMDAYYFGTDERHAPHSEINTMGNLAADDAVALVWDGGGQANG
jgi:hypothetical protein